MARRDLSRGWPETFYGERLGDEFFPGGNPILAIDRCRFWLERMFTDVSCDLIDEVVARAWYDYLPALRRSIEAGGGRYQEHVAQVLNECVSALEDTWDWEIAGDA